MSALLTPPVPPKPAGSAPLPPTAPKPHLFTVRQFHQMGELGFFEGRRASLIHGTIFEEGPMNPPHAIAGEKTEDVIRAVFQGWRVRVQKPLVLSQAIDPEPDVAVMAGQPTLAGGHPTTAALVIEISDTSLDYDLTVKAELYATAKIAEYWVLDVDGRQLHVFRDPAPLPAGLGATAYQTHLTFTDAQSASPLAVPAAVVRVADLLP